jgi:glycosyltransferase involved in cell wall biosynthesis
VRARRARYRTPLLAATAITAATGQVAELDGPWLGRTPTVLIPGFDDAEWAAARAAARPNPDRFEVVFTGKLYETYRRPDTFLEGLRLAADRLGPRGHERLRFVYYGRSGPFLAELAERYGCADVVEDRGFVDPAAVPALTAGAGALLLLTNNAGDSGVPGGKFFEYLAAHRPILAVPGGDRYVAEVFSRTGSGRLADDPGQVADVLVDWFGRWQATGSLPFDGDADAVNEFSANTSALRLADLLHGAAVPAGR